MADLGDLLGSAASSNGLEPPELASELILATIKRNTTASDYLRALNQGDRVRKHDVNSSSQDYLENLHARTPPATDDEELYLIREYIRMNDIELTPLTELRTGVCYDPRMRFHCELPGAEDALTYHPEDPRRILCIFKILCENGLIEGAYPPKVRLAGRTLLQIPSRYATKKECCRVHEEQHYDDLALTASATDVDLLTKTTAGESVYFNQSTFISALLAAGSAIETTRAVIEGKVRNAFAIIRPPGHHAESSVSSGFCHFDNVAVAAKDALTEYPEKVKKILIIDWDVHHGNGIQNAFIDNPDVLYVSLHVHANGTFYPMNFVGALDKHGGGEGKGFNINIPWEGQGMTDGDYLLAFQHIIMPVAREFEPDLVMIASGFDAADGDQLGGCHVTPPCYAQMTHMLMSLADGKVVGYLEGGYNLRSISVSALAVVKTLMGEPPSRVHTAQPTQSGKRTVFDVIKHHQQFWKSLLPKDKSLEMKLTGPSSRLHDLVRVAQAGQLFDEFRMFEVPMPRTGEPNSISWKKQVLATAGFRRAQKLMVVFHDEPSMGHAYDPATGSYSLGDALIADPAYHFITWAVKRDIAVIDVNIPRHYTGISHDKPNIWDEAIHKTNKKIWSDQLDHICKLLWEKFVKDCAADQIVILGLGDAFAAAQRIFKSHSWDDFQAKPTRAVGIIHTRIPDAIQQGSASFERFDDHYFKWTTVWAPATDRVFVQLRNGKTKKRYGDCIKSSETSLPAMVQVHEYDVKEKILEGLGLDPDTEGSDPSGDSDDDGNGNIDDTGGLQNILGDDDTANSTRKRRPDARADGDQERALSRRRVI